MDRTASSQAAWALLTEGVTAARLKAHRLQLLWGRLIPALENLPEADQERVYQVLGDVVEISPKRLTELIIDLDRTLLALSGMGEDFLRSRLPLMDTTLVDEATTPAFGGGGRSRISLPEQIAATWLEQVANAY